MSVSRHLIVAGLLAASITAVHAQEWCGFKDKSGSRVRCGYSSFAECIASEHGKAANGKATICMPDPSFAQRRAAAGPRIADAGF